MVALFQDLASDRYDIQNANGCPVFTHLRRRNDECHRLGNRRIRLFSGRSPTRNEIRSLDAFA